MGISKCPKCGSSRFELKINNDVKGSKYPIAFIQCESCSTVVGTTEEYYANRLLEKIAEKLDIN